jgi:multidrug resistance efflux pump
MAGFGLLLLVGSFLVLNTGADYSQLANNLVFKNAGEKPAKTAPSKDDRSSVAVAFVDVEEGVTPLYPTRPGRVIEVAVRDGDTVKKGDVLLRVDDSLAQIDLKRAKLAVSGAEIRLRTANRLVEKFQKQVEAMEASVEVQRAEQAEAEAGLAKAQSFYQNKIGGTAEDVALLEKKVAKAKAGVLARQKELEALKTMDPSDAVEAAKTDLAEKMQQVKAAEKGIEECIVRAPQNGSMLRSMVNVGEVLGPNPQRPAMIFCPEGPRIIRAEVEQEFARSIYVGQHADIRDDATGSSKWTGQVIRISDWYAHRRSIILEPMQFNDVRTMEVILSVQDDGSAPLRIGQRVLVTLRNKHSEE